MSQSGSSADRLQRLAPLLSAEPENLPLHRECVELAMRGREYPRALQFIDSRLARHPAEAESLFARAAPCSSRTLSTAMASSKRRRPMSALAREAVLQN